MITEVGVDHDGNVERACVGPGEVVALRPAVGMPASAPEAGVGRRLRIPVHKHDPLREEQLA